VPRTRFFLLAVITALERLGVISALPECARAQNPHRAGYVCADGFVGNGPIVAYIAWGAKRHGSSLRELIGGKWNNLKDFSEGCGHRCRVFGSSPLAVLLCTAVALHARQGRPGHSLLAPAKTSWRFFFGF